MRIPHNDPLSSGSLDTPERARRGGSAAADPERKCVLTGDNGPRDELMRLAISPDGLVLPDVLAKAPGRGAWIGVSRPELEAAIAKGKLKGALARAFKGASLTIPDDLADRCEAALLRAFTDRLGLEMRAGHLLLGAERIAEKARGGRVAWLAHAADASEDGARRIDQAWRVGEEEEGSGKAGVRLPLDRAALSVALGRENVVHLALTAPAAAKRIDGLLRRLVHFLGPRNQGQDDVTKPSDAGERAAGNAGPVAETTE